MKLKDREEIKNLIKHFLEKKYEKKVQYEKKEFILDIFDELKKRFFGHYIPFIKGEILIFEASGHDCFVARLGNDEDLRESLFTIIYNDDDKTINISHSEKKKKIELTRGGIYEDEAERLLEKIGEELRLFFYNFWIDYKYGDYSLIFRVRLKKYIRQEFLFPIMVYDCAGIMEKMNLASRENKAAERVCFFIVPLDLMIRKKQIIPFAISNNKKTAKLENCNYSLRLSKRAINKFLNKVIDDYTTISWKLETKKSSSLKITHNEMLNRRSWTFKKTWEKILDFFV